MSTTLASNRVGRGRGHAPCACECRARAAARPRPTTRGSCRPRVAVPGRASLRLRACARSRSQPRAARSTMLSAACVSRSGTLVRRTLDGIASIHSSDGRGLASVEQFGTVRDDEILERAPTPRRRRGSPPPASCRRAPRTNRPRASTALAAARVRWCAGRGAGTRARAGGSGTTWRARQPGDEHAPPLERLEHLAAVVAPGRRRCTARGGDVSRTDTSMRNRRVSSVSRSRNSLDRKSATLRSSSAKRSMNSVDVVDGPQRRARRAAPPPASPRSAQRDARPGRR